MGTPGSSGRNGTGLIDFQKSNETGYAAMKWKRKAKNADNPEPDFQFSEKPMSASLSAKGIDYGETGLIEFQKSNETGYSSMAWKRGHKNDQNTD